MRSAVRTAVVALVALATAAVLAAAGISTAGAAPSGGSGTLAGQHPRQLPAPTGAQGSASTPEYAHDHVLVRFRTGTTTSQQTARVRAAGGTAVRAVAAASGFARVYTTDVAASLRQLKADPSVASVGYDYIRRASTTPNDPGYDPQFQKAYLDLVRLPSAWSVTTGSPSQVIAVVDSGVDATAPDLSGKVLAGYHFVNGTSGAGGAPGPIDNSCDEPSATGHGTFVASVAAANTNNAYGLAGAGWSAHVLPVRVLNQCGEGQDSDIAAGVTWAADHGATVINMSLGGSDPAPSIQAAMQYAEGKGIPVVVAAGNDGTSVPQYPAAYPEAIAVGATDETGHLTSFSSFGDWVDLAAPGWDIVGEEPRALCADASEPSPTDCYYIGAGTSFAAPLVAGTVALMKTKFPTLTPAQIATRLELTARDTGPAGGDPFYGYGVLDAYAALDGPRQTPLGGRVAAAQNHTPATATVLATGLSNHAFDLEGESSWYSVPAAPATMSVTVSPVTSQTDPTNPLAQTIDPIVRAYDSTHHLLATATADTSGSATLLTTFPAGALLSITNANGSSAVYRVQLTTVGVAGVPVVGSADWVGDVQPAPTGAVPSPASTIGTGVDPTVTFDRAMDASTFTSGSVVLSNGTTGATVASSTSYDAGTQTLTITPSAPLLGATSYRLTLNGGSPATPVTDSGAAVMPEFHTSFVVGPAAVAAVTGLTGVGSPWGATLHWAHPQNGDLSAVYVRYVLGTTPPTGPTGTIAYTGTQDATTVTGLTAGHDYAFSVFDYTATGRSANTSIVLHGSTTTLTSSLASPLYGQSTTITATVKTTDGLAAPGRSVTLYSRRTGTTAYAALGTATTNASGQVSLTQVPTVNTDYYAVDAGGAGMMGSTATKAVPVRFLVTSTTIPATAAVGATVRFGGGVSPTQTSGRVLLEGLWGGVWHLLGYGNLTAHSTYWFKLVPTRKSIYVYRVYKEATASLSAGATAHFSMTVT